MSDHIISRQAAKSSGLLRYFTGAPCKNGHIAPRKVANGACAVCAAAKYKKYISSPAGYAKKLAATKTWKANNQGRIKAKHAIWCKDNWHQLKFLYLRSAAKQRGHEFDLSPEDLNYPEYCPALGIKLNYDPKPKGSKAGPVKNSPSVDRIDSSKGYIKGNVVVVSQLANSIKSSATPEQIMQVALFYRDLK